MNDNEANQGPASAPSGKGALRPRARLLRTLGNDLISSDKVALIELVKNSYDADARIVIVRFHGPLTTNAGRIEVWDDGHGMNAETVQASWLDIATDTKRRNPRSSRGRRVLGEKGIGRLAAARLGAELLLTTRESGTDEVRLFIDWTEFDRENAYLDEIEVVWEIGAPTIFTPKEQVEDLSVASAGRVQTGHGTLLQIDRLTHPWARSDLVELRTALTRLIRPNASKEAAPGQAAFSDLDEATPDFQIYLELLDVDESMLDLAGPIEPSDELNTPHYRLSGHVSTNGVATLQYSQQDPPFDEEVQISLWTDDTRQPEVGAFELDLSVWDRDNQALRRTLQEANDGAPNARALKGFRDILDDIAGVSIYRDGFRVLPFGERGDDWLGLDRRRVQSPTLRLSNNQIIGRIFIEADTNRGLQDQSNREGFLEGPSYADLQVIMRSVLNELEQRRYVARRQTRPKEEGKTGLFQKFDLADIRGALAASYPADSRIIGLVDRKSREIQDGVTEVQNVLSRYSRLATLGSLIDRVLHDGRTVVARIKNIARFGKRDLAKKTLSHEEKIEAAIGSMDQTGNQAELLSALFNQIEPFGGRKRGRPKDVYVDDVIRKAISVLQVDADDRSVKLTAAGNGGVVRLDESEILIVLVNLIQNAIHWSATGPREARREVIVGSRRNDDGSFTIVVSDSGPGVAPDLRGHIFDPYFSSKPEGIGLGLSIVGNIVEDIYGGELLLVDDGPMEGATFEATFRRRV